MTTVLMDIDFGAGTPAEKAAKLAEWYWTHGDAGDVMAPVLATEGGCTFARVAINKYPTAPYGFVDPNHCWPGRGYLALLFQSGRKDPGTDPSVHPARAFPAISNLVGHTLEYEMRVRDFCLPPGAFLLQHVQTVDHSFPPEITTAGEARLAVNAIQIANPLCKQLGFDMPGVGIGRRNSVAHVRDSGWRTVQVPFNARPADWAMLGATHGRTQGGGTSKLVNYGCPVSIESFLSDWNGNMMMVAFFGTASAETGFRPEECRVSGILDVRRVRLLGP